MLVIVKLPQSGIARAKPAATHDKARQSSITVIASRSLARQSQRLLHSDVAVRNDSYIMGTRLKLKRVILAKLVLGYDRGAGIRGNKTCHSRESGNLGLDKERERVAGANYRCEEYRYKEGCV